MIGTELGHYQIVDSLGRGGMGRVYVGEHQLLGRRAAIKVLDQKFDDDDTVNARFINEARAVSASSTRASSRSTILVTRRMAARTS